MAKIINSDKLLELIKLRTGDNHLLTMNTVKDAIADLSAASGITDRERAIIMAYTGASMLIGDKLSIFYAYVEEKLGRPVFSHELGYIETQEELKDAARDDFIALCSGTKEIPDNWQKDDAMNIRR